VLWSDSVSGVRERVTIDISWIKDKLPALDQDDEITLSVEILPSGKLQALSVISAKTRTGTVNEGLSTGSEDVTEARHDRARQQDEDTIPVTVASPPISGVLSGVVTNLLTGAPIPGATVRLDGFAATTDAAGAYSISGVPPGSYQVEASAPGFIAQTQPVVIQATVGSQLSFALRPLPGALTGVVRSLVTGAPLPGATVRLNGFTAITDAAGAYSIADIPPGSYQVEASAPGFIAQTQPVTIQSTTTSRLDFSLATAFPNLTFTLVWGSQPPDLDAHLSGPASAGGRFHAFFLNPNPETYVSFTGDVQTGFGPEQIIVRPNPATGQYVAGDYHFWVDNPAADFGASYSGSQARVIVNRDAQLLGAFDVTAATGDPTLRLWHVVNVQIDAAGNVTVQPVQQFTNGDSLVVLRPPYGAKPPRR
jgi:hypothetical protein